MIARRRAEPTKLVLEPFRIDACGYYHHNGAHAFASPEEVATGLAAWVSGRRLIDTCTMAGGPLGVNASPMYCRHVHTNGGELLFSMWQAVDDPKLSVGSVSGEATVGQAEPQELRVEEGHIAGAPRLYWLLPDAGVVVALRFEGRVSGRSEFERYVRRYLAHCSPTWTSRLPPTDDIVYAPAPHAAPVPGLRARFKLVALPDPSLADQVRARATQITGILFRGWVRPTAVQQNLGAVSTLLSRVLGLGGLARSDDERVKLQLLIPGRPNPDELERLITRPDELGLASGEVGVCFGSGAPRELWLHGRHTALALEFATADRSRLRFDHEQLLATVRSQAGAAMRARAAPPAP